MTEYRALAYLSRLMPSERIADLYDEDDFVADALNALIPDFEYLDWSHKTVGDALKFCKERQ